MKITSKVLYQRVKGALSEALHLDLSGLGIGAIESLELCPSLESLDLSRNCLEEVENFECCKNLWRINLSDNKITCLGTLSRMVAIGTLDLSNNDLSWNELLRIRHVIILDLHLYGNENLDSDTFYRLHVIDCLPNVWMLDGRLITCAERLQVQHFFQDSALSSRPVRHKLNEKSYAYFKPTKSTEIHGSRTSKFCSLFPAHEAHNSDTDRRRLEFLAYNIQEDLKNKKKSMKRPSSWISNNCLKIIIENRHVDKEKCNMLLLLLASSLEFDLPPKLLSETLALTKLNPLFGTDTEQLFQLDPSARTQVISLLVSSCKLDREVNKPTCGGLYDRLYLCLYHSVAHLLQRTSKAKRKYCFDKSSKSCRPSTSVSHYRYMVDTKAASYKKQLADWKSHQTLLASELVLLLSVVPSFYQLIVSKNPSIYNVVSKATGDDQFYEKLTVWSEQLMADGGDTNALCREICRSVIRRIEQATEEKFSKSTRSFLLGKQTQTAQTNLILKTPDAYPKRPKSAVLTSGERLTKAKKFEKPAEYINLIRPYDMQHLTLGSYVLLGPQNLARVVALPETHIALVQMDLIPSLNGSVKVFAKDQDEHYCYVDIRKLTYDHAGHYWKPRGAVGDKVTLQLDEEIVVSSVAEEKALKRERSKLTSKSITARPVYSAGAKKLPMQRPTSPTFSQRLSPVNSLTFISREPSRIETDDKEPFHPAPRPLSTLYCERMELTLSDLSYRTDSSYPAFYDGPNHPFESDGENGLYGATFVTENPPPTLEDSDRSGAPGSPPKNGNEEENAPWDGKTNGEIEHFVENQRSKSHESLGTDGSSIEDGKQVDDPERANETLDTHMEIPEDPVQSDTSTPLVSFRATDEPEEVVYENEEELEKRLQNANLGDEEEPELQKLLLDEDADNPESNLRHFEGTEQARDMSPTAQAIEVAKMKLMTKASNRRWFSISGETMALKQRTPENKKPRAKSAAETVARPNLRGPPSRPVSAILTPKKLLFYQKELMQDESRPGSASSFQMMRTEAWRSSASSASTGFPTSATNAAKFTQFVVNDQLNRTPKVKFSMRIKRPPPQRPTSPHESPRDESEASLPSNSNFSAPSKLTLANNLQEPTQSEPLSTSRWLAQGRDLHLENVQTRQQLSAHKVPGYLEGIYLPPNLMKKRRYIPKAKVGIDTLPARPVKPSAMLPYTYHRRGTSGDQVPRDSTNQLVSHPTSWSRPRFSTLSDIKRISALHPERFVFHYQPKR